MRKRILFICPVWDVGNSFVRNDLELLSRNFEMVRISYTPKDRLFFLRLLKHLPKYDLCFVWFSAEHAFWALLAARVVSRKIVIVGGGYDSVFMPEIGYGIRHTNKMWRLGYFSFKHADLVLSFSEHSKRSIETISGARRVRTVYMGFKGNEFTPSPGGKVDKTVITVCRLTEANYKRKGLGTFLEAARRMPDTRFIIVGEDADGTGERIRKEGISNLLVTGGLNKGDLIRHLSQTKVYAQLSAHEGFGCALAEAMLCECVPVVTNRGSLREVAGPDAFYVEYDDADGATEKINEAFAVDSGAKYRKRILTLFPLEKREREICSLIESLIDSRVYD